MSFFRPAFFFALFISCLSVHCFAFAEEPQPTPSALAEVQQELYAQDFQAFALQVQVGIPNVHTITHPSLPPYNPGASRNDWVNTFTDAIATQSHLNPTELKAFEDSVQNIFFGYSNNEPYGKVNFLSPAPDTGSEKSDGVAVQSIRRVRLLERYPSPHTMGEKGLSDYVSQRFAQPIQDFIRSNHVPLYGHDSNCADAIQYHRNRGYSVVEQYSSDVDGPSPPNFIAYNPRSHRYLFGVCDLIGKDDVTRITEILGPIFYSNRAYLVHHKHPESLFDLNETGKSFKFDAQDRVFIGYQNTVWWQLHTSANGADWQRILMSNGGVETDLFYNSKTGQKIVSVANCYGDEMKIVLEFLYSKGARRFAYFGTAGGFDPSLDLADVLIPTHFRFRPTGESEEKNIPFDNTAMTLGLKLPTDSQIRLGSQQDWVPTLVEESVANVESMRDAKSQAMDVESRYIAEFFANHPASEKTVVITISDLPLGGETYVDAGAHREKSIQNLNALLTQILGN